MILVLSLLLLLLSDLTLLHINISQYQLVQNQDFSFEIIQTKVIQKAKRDFYDQKMDDFTLNYKDYTAQGSYEECELSVIIEGKNKVQMTIYYDDVLLCIREVEYNYETDPY